MYVSKGYYMRQQSSYNLIQRVNIKNKGIYVCANSEVCHPPSNLTSFIITLINKFTIEQFPPDIQGSSLDHPTSEFLKHF